MTIHEYYYNEENRTLYVEFSTKEDADQFYRILELGFADVELYSPEIIDESGMNEVENDFIVDLINQYVNDNHLPDEIIL